MSEILIIGVTVFCVTIVLITLAVLLIKRHRMRTIVNDMYVMNEWDNRDF